MKKRPILASSVSYIGVLLLSTACVAQAPVTSTRGWSHFVQVEGQPEPIPVEWVSTPEGKHAHSIKIPNPVPKDSGYRPGMSSEKYFEHLCNNEAGEFIFSTADKVEGFLLMRPPKQPSDDDLMSRFKLEAPDIERMFQLYNADPGSRSTIFVVPGIRHYRYIEEMFDLNQFVMAFGYESGTNRLKPTVRATNRTSRYGLTWRGIKRAQDREHAIAGNEWIVLDLANGNVLAVFRNYARTGRVENTNEGLWWLNAVQCPSPTPLLSAGRMGGQIYEKLESVLRPNEGRAK